MIELKSKPDLERLRRFALQAQGLTQSKPFGLGRSGATKAIAHLGYVQIDTISVVERAHHHVFRSRVPNFSPNLINDMLRKQEVFEYWSHAAAFLPIQDFRYSLPYKQAIKSGQRHWFKQQDPKLMADLLKRITVSGPLRSRDVEDARGNAAGWWDWKPAKRALEQLYMQGDLMVRAREGFQKTYDLPERVLPTGIDRSVPSLGEFAEHLLEQQLRCHGFVSLKGMTYQRRNPDLRHAIKVLVNQGASSGQLDQFRLNGETFYCLAGLLDQTKPRVSNEVRILSPFDNTVIQRARLSAIFNFDYQIECYVPEAKRQYGYFCLPILYKDQFVGRIDCKAHRKTKHLELKAAFFEGVTGDAFAIAFANALVEFAKFQGCDRIDIGHISPKSFQTSIAQQIGAQMAAR